MPSYSVNTMQPVTDDFEDVILDIHSLKTPTKIQDIKPIDYNSSISSSSTSSSARCSTNSSASSHNDDDDEDDDDEEEDEEIIKKNYTASPSITQLPKPSQKPSILPSSDSVPAAAPRRCSANTVLSLSTVASSSSSCSESSLSSSDEETSNGPPQNFALTANKLNGYLLHTLKSKSSISLLNQNQASAQSRQSSYKESPSLFTSPSLVASSKEAANSSRRHSANSVVPIQHQQQQQQQRNSAQPSHLYASSTTDLSYSPSFSNKSRFPRLKTSVSTQLLAQTQNADLRLNDAEPTTPSSYIPESINETDAFAPLPTTKRNLQRALSRSNRKHSISSISSSENPTRTNSLKMAASDMNLGRHRQFPVPPYYQQQQQQQQQPPPLTAQQKLRLRRSKSSARLTSKQLEQQFDSEDVDDEIPNDYSLVWNVPLSPALYAKTQIKSIASQKSKMASTKNSNKHSRRKSNNNSNNNSNGTISPPTVNKDEAASPDSEKSLACIKESEPTVYFTDAGLEDLCEEARVLTIAFQDLPNSKTFDMDPNKVNSNRSSTTSFASSTFSSRPTSTLTAATDSSPNSPSSPLQNGSNLPPKHWPSEINSNDPVPVSKEKEAVLSRTRPSWLPPKSAEEERRHVYEYQQMMAHVNQLEQKQEQKKRQEQAAREKQRKADLKIWETKILPNFEKSLQSPSTRELWWRGIPQKYRPMVWQSRIGNNLQITQDTFQLALKRAALVKKFDVSETNEQHQNKLIADLDLESITKLKSQFAQMLVDAPETYPELKMFDKHTGPLYDPLVEVLTAFALYQPSIGYQYGLNYIAATLLLNFDTLNSFICLCNMMMNHSVLLKSLYMNDERELVPLYQSFLKVLNEKMATLHAHLKKHRIGPNVYLPPMIKPLFGSNRYFKSLASGEGECSVDVVSRIWDIMIFEGDSFLLRVGLTILQKFEHKLYAPSTQRDMLAVLGYYHSSVKNQPSIIKVGDDSEDSFIDEIRQVLKKNN